ncbi:MAG: preprotein translocase subunit YajC [Candidatus Omnitrophota bacterium]
MPTDQVSNPFLSSLMIPYILIIAIFYFLVIKPQKDRQKQHKLMLENLKKNDEIVTTGGIHATIINVKDKTVIIRIDDNVKMEIDKEAIAVVTKSAN